MRSRKEKVLSQENSELKRHRDCDGTRYWILDRMYDHSGKLRIQHAPIERPSYIAVSMFSPISEQDEMWSQACVKIANSGLVGSFVADRNNHHQRSSLVTFGTVSFVAIQFTFYTHMGSSREVNCVTSRLEKQIVVSQA
jgi:hypothetical protein